MSYNSDPKWTTQVSIVDISDLVCPTCKTVPENLHQVMNCLYESDYYEPRHIPPILTFTCFNQECPDCDRDFEYEVSVLICLRRVMQSLK